MAQELNINNWGDSRWSCHYCGYSYIPGVGGVGSAERPPVQAFRELQRLVKKVEASLDGR